MKRFASNLSAGQKTQILESLDRVTETARERNVEIANWYLTMPLDPTPENLEWLAVQARERPFEADWRGLNFIDGLASDHPQVIDYYLRDGKDRLQAAQADLIRLLAKRGSNGLEVSPAEAFEEDIASILRAINQYDPHLRYSFRVDEVQVDAMDEPGLVYSQQQQIGERAWVTYLVYERLDGALEDRPLHWEIQVDTSSSEVADKFERFLLFGDGFVGPATIKGDAPAALGEGHTARGPFRLRPQQSRKESATPSACVSSIATESP